MFHIHSLDLPAFLLETGLFSNADLLDREWMAISANSRNHCWKILAPGGLNLFLKQPGKWLPEYTNSFAMECHFTIAIKTLASLASLRPHTPALVVYHPGVQVLVTELIEPAENLYEYHARVREFPDTLSVQAGAIFGHLHRVPLNAPDIADLKAKLPFERPWIFNTGFIHQRVQSQQTKAEIMLYQLVQTNPEFPQLIASAGYAWEINSIIHGDMKWPNLLVEQSRGAAHPVLKVIDWELASLGDPCWDVAGLFQAYITFWLLHLRQDKPIGTVALNQLEVFSLDQMQPAMRRFWQSYSETMGWRAETKAEKLLKCVKFAAVRMIQTCIEGSKHEGDLMPNTARTLQVSLNMLKYPQDAAHEILGITA